MSSVCKVTENSRLLSRSDDFSKEIFQNESLKKYSTTNDKSNVVEYIKRNNIGFTT